MSKLSERWVPEMRTRSELIMVVIGAVSIFAGLLGAWIGPFGLLVLGGLLAVGAQPLSNRVLYELDRRDKVSDWEEIAPSEGGRDDGPDDAGSLPPWT